MSNNADDTDHRSEHIRRAIDLVVAVAEGDADKRDIQHPAEIVAGLREQGIDSLDVLINVLVRTYRQGKRSNRGGEPFDIRSLGRGAPDPATPIIHQAPKVPFVMDGTLYDPKDISRFDGKALHFVASDSRRGLVAFEDLSVVSRFWEMTYVAAMAGVQLGAKAPMRTATFAAGPEEFPTMGWPDFDEGHGGYFYSDSGPDGWGDELYCVPNRGFARLSLVPRGFLGAGDWNDVISACACYYVNIVQLWEHKNWGGSSYTGGSQSQLDWLGWNDRASGVACW